MLSQQQKDNIPFGSCNFLVFGETCSLFSKVSIYHLTIWKCFYWCMKGFPTAKVNAYFSPFFLGFLQHSTVYHFLPLWNFQISSCLFIFFIIACWSPLRILLFHTVKYWWPLRFWLWCTSHIKFSLGNVIVSQILFLPVCWWMLGC